MFKVRQVIVTPISTRVSGKDEGEKENGLRGTLDMLEGAMASGAQ